jgi:hypothetical protein
MFGTLAWKNNFHKFLRHNSYSIFKAISKFGLVSTLLGLIKLIVQEVEHNNNLERISDFVENKKELLVPKVFADLWESVAAAILLDSFFDVEVWISVRVSNPRGCTKSVFRSHGTGGS